jgi:hypothetical protein
VASPILYKGQRRLALLHRTGASEGPEPRNDGPWELRPYERSRCAEHGVSVNSAWERSMPAPPEVDMVSPQMLLRNASMAQI